MRYNIDVLKRGTERNGQDDKIVSGKNGKFIVGGAPCALFRITARRTGVCKHMAGNPWNPRVRQIRGGRDAAIIEPISKNSVD